MFLTFLRRLIRSVDHKIYLIVDNLSVHKAGKVKKWLERHKEQIQIFYLPPYSPYLNPDEFLNNDVKNNASGRQRPRTRDEMTKNLRSYLHSTQKCPYIVKNYFKSEKVAYAAA